MRKARKARSTNCGRFKSSMAGPVVVGLERGGMVAGAGRHEATLRDRLSDVWVTHQSVRGDELASS